MSAKSTIEWTESTWNPVTGCSKISEGCRYCYAERMAKRLHAMGNPKYCNGFKPTLHESAIDEPLKWKRSRMVFVCSMSDLFHKEVPTEFIQKVFSIMNRCTHHVFQVLTKRSSRLLEIQNHLEWTPNIWVGVTVESDQYTNRIKDLNAVDAQVRFLSMEPLLSDISDPELEGIDWVIVGGESGPHSRPMRPEWVRGIKDHCQRKDVPFFFKQWGGVNKKKSGRVLDGKVYSQYPVSYPLYCI